ncbi:SPOR domain-containing protein [Undibacterium oligocarboniphilum]|uniref:SPOR domain-containing protein n=1 Tax=Undibacterium oligocarboniphilum TaxID=666702 RepID=A0A850QBD0_9BURK|nr:SPOR domain-containing protein [Undibacterium oligocarboniphilum]MBC3870797.1 SPOR domain-containing protein [Undibacterium oligocarboniphilum]NVO76579.1 SPOR domain-containing protein [Undibacterium oligocarboniphilum]
MKTPSTTLQHQRGNTLTGIIIGLVIGLGIAVAVALLITKSSTPFTNKGGKSDKSDQPVTQLQDPNKPLYGNKDAVKEAAKDVAKAPETVTPANSAAPVKTAEVKTESKPAADKLADSAKADSADDKYIYFLQAGAFKEQADAESARARLALIGFEAKVSEKTSDTGTMYRVRIGPFSNIETMNRIRSKLSENSIDVAVVRTAK